MGKKQSFPPCFFSPTSSDKQPPLTPELRAAPGRPPCAAARPRRRRSYRLPLAALLAGFRLLELGLEGLRVAVLSVLVQDVHQVGDVARGQPQRLDLGQLGVGGHVGDALAQLGEGRVDALRPPPLLAVGGGPPLHGARVRVLVLVVVVMVVRAHRRPVHRERAGARHQAAGAVVVVVRVVRVGVVMVVVEVQGAAAGR